jgi:hypothetical protein
LVQYQAAILPATEGNAANSGLLIKSILNALEAAA